MKEFVHSDEISSYLQQLVKEGKSIGFVPTMGALHRGHMELIKQAKAETDVVICSVFINPLQFNRKEDLENYPNRLDSDREMLRSVNCDLLFTPNNEELYADQPQEEFDFGSLGEGMEAEYRPGHFKGVAAVIERFLTILKPHKAYFGEKDYQQLAIVRWVKEKFHFNTEIVGCQTVRYESGLAMSSRNYLLKDEEFETAAGIYQCMQYCKSKRGEIPPKDLGEECFRRLQKNFKPEYFVIADESSLKPIENWEESKRPRAFVAAYLSSVRLIDNLSLID